MSFHRSFSWLLVGVFCLCLSLPTAEAQFGRQVVVHSQKTPTSAPTNTVNPQEGDFCGLAGLSCTSVEIGGNPTGGSLSPDTVINVDLGTGGVDATVLGIGWDLHIDSSIPSWRSEATVDINGALTLSAGLGDDVSGSATYSSDGINDLTMIDLNGDGTVDTDLSFIATSGMLSLVLFESFDDAGLDPDGMYLANSTITIEYFVPGVCDFDSDGDCDVSDINLMLGVGPISGGVSASGNEIYDLDGSGMIDLSDRDLWLANAASENGLGSPYNLGDANLDGTVDGVDFVAWNANKFSTSLSWDAGDFNADGFVDGNDFIAWNANKFTSSDSVAAVPEPSCVFVMLLGMLGLIAAKRR